jgi:hypothetical protein
MKYLAKYAGWGIKGSMSRAGKDASTRSLGLSEMVEELH